MSTPQGNNKKNVVSLEFLRVLWRENPATQLIWQMASTILKDLSIRGWRWISSINSIAIGSLLVKMDLLIPEPAKCSLHMPKRYYSSKRIDAYLMGTKGSPKELLLLGKRDPNQKLKVNKSEALQKDSGQFL